MQTVIGVRVRENKRLQFFDPQGGEYFQDDIVIVEKGKYNDYGTVVMEETTIKNQEKIKEISKIIRKANNDDLKRIKQGKAREKDASKLFMKKVKAHGIDMKLIRSECFFSGNKILFYFTADGRVDFRTLVKDLASSLRARIELRQIGVRDEARMLGGLGSCGNPVCCCGFLDDFHTVSIKMAKEQGLSLNPSKISGTCGRLMCCLKFEHLAYEELSKSVPKPGSIVKTPKGEGKVLDCNVISKKLKVSVKEFSESVPLIFDVSDVKLIKKGEIKEDNVELEELKTLE